MKTFNSLIAISFLSIIGTVSFAAAPSTHYCPAYYQGQAFFVAQFQQGSTSVNCYYGSENGWVQWTQNLSNFGFDQNAWSPQQPYLVCGGYGSGQTYSDCSFTSSSTPIYTGGAVSQ